ncbi:MAG: ABC transporter ATP-binding protein [Clostridiales bacterium]|nr:ABC transporter ATP-binding protein [Clostridiales bacterium]
MIHTTHLRKKYTLDGQEVAALDGVDIHIARGEYVAIVGPSGSGKSTLMNILGCLDVPDSGEYVLAGRNVAKLPPADLSRIRGAEIGFVFQGFQLLPRLTALENVALPLMLCGVAQQQRLKKAEDLLRRVGMGDRLHHRPCELSGGQQQRVAIARALARDPALLLADEPTGSLDPASAEAVMDLLDEMHREGRTLVLITHDEKAARRAPRRLVLERGRILQQD